MGIQGEGICEVQIESPIGERTISAPLSQVAARPTGLDA